MLRKTWCVPDIEAGVRTLDSSVAGPGGCPYASKAARALAAEPKNA